MYNHPHGASIIMGLRFQAQIPEWITHIALVQRGHVEDRGQSNDLGQVKLACAKATILVDMQNVNAIATGFDWGFVPLGPRGLGLGMRGELSEPKRSWRADRVWAAWGQPHVWGGNAEVEERSLRSSWPFTALRAAAV
ncbi:hypothetical protein BJV74DRAFT_796023 [Russula compacta]|nr:hypothetical protein BJV74DRAFT_796023 [Russula compacta]